MILTHSCLITTYHVYRGSRNVFAFTLQVFVGLFGLYDIFGVFVLDGLKYNPTWAYTANYAWYLCYLQSWIFAMKYFTSARKSLRMNFIS